MTKQDARERALGLLYAADVGADGSTLEPTGRAGRLAVGVIDHLDEIVDRQAGEAQAGLFQLRTIIVVDLVTMTMAFDDLGLAVAGTESLG